MSVEKRNTDVAIMKAVQHNPDGAALIAKLTHSRLLQATRIGDGVDTHAMATTSMGIARRRQDARMAMDIFPDVKLAATTLIGLILSPLDGVTTEFRYDFMADIGLPAAAVGEIQNIIKEYLEDLGLREIAHEIMDLVVTKDGAAPILIMPESALDAFINNPGSLTTEGEHASPKDAELAFKMSLVHELDKIFDAATGQPRSLGVLRNPQAAPTVRSAIESMFGESNEVYDPRLVYAYKSAMPPNTTTPKYALNIAAESTVPINEKWEKVNASFTSVIDNPNVMRMPVVAKKLRELSAEKVTEASRLREGYTKYNGDDARHGRVQMSDREIKNAVFRNPSAPTSAVFATFKSPEYLERRTVGKPFWKFLPAESVIVVFEPSDPRNRTHYVVVIDPDGNPLRIEPGADSFSMLSKQFNGFSDNTSVVSSTLGQLAQSRLNGFTNTDDTYAQMRMLNNLHHQLVDADLMARLRASFGSGELQLGADESIYDAMLARELSNRQTQLCLVPASMINYFAFNIGSDGIGRSLLDDSRNILAIRAMLLVSEVFNSIRNSISRTNVEIGFDSRDKDPFKTAEMIKSGILASRGTNLPWGTFDLGALAMHIQRAGIEFTYAGNNPQMLNTTINYTESQSQHQMPDETFRDYLKSLSLAGFNMTPDMLETTGQEELATAVKLNRAQLARRVSMVSNMFNAEFKVLVRRLIMYNGDIMRRIAVVVGKNLEAVVRHDNKTKKLDKSISNIIVKAKELHAAGKLTKELKISMTRNYVDGVVKEYLSTFDCTLPAHVRSSFPDRVKEVEEKIAALETVMKYIASTDMYGHIFKDPAVLTAWTNQVTADCARQWFADAGIDAEIARYLEKPDVTTDLNVKGKAMTEFTAALTLQVLNLARHDKVASVAVDSLTDQYGLGADGSGSDDGGGDSSTGEGTDSGDGGGDDSLMGGDDFSFDDPSMSDGDEASEPEASPDTSSEPEASEPEATEPTEPPAEPPADDEPKPDTTAKDEEKKE